MQGRHLRWLVFWCSLIYACILFHKFLYIIFTIKFKIIFYFYFIFYYFSIKSKFSYIWKKYLLLCTWCISFHKILVLLRLKWVAPFFRLGRDPVNCSIWASCGAKTCFWMLDGLPCFRNSFNSLKNLGSSKNCLSWLTKSNISSEQTFQNQNI